MIMKLFNFTYFLIAFLTLAIVFLFYYLFKNKSSKTKRILILVIMFLNVFQHFFKFIVWPHLYGTGFNKSNTLYNMCAFLIVVSPLSFFLGSNSFKTFNYLLGTIAGFGAICYPYWFFNQTIFQFDYLRFYTCHFLLFFSSILSLLFKVAEINFKDFYKMGFYYLLSCVIILFNNLCCAVITCGLDPASIFLSLYSDNPCYIMSPPDNVEWLKNILVAITPSIFKGGDNSYYTPILWSAIPVYLGITLISFVIFYISHKRKERKH